ncbi:MAG: recombinase family protein [bacterium]|nr:recombinase family protein [bacterium]MDE0419194.1 recombinase family protein [bacterium]
MFRQFANGASPRAIAQRLNADGVPAPTAGKLWTDSPLRGHAGRGTGIFHNELYIGRLVWNRQRFLKNPVTGKWVAWINPPEEWIIAPAPELRIVNDELWRTAKARQREIAGK